MEIRSLQQAVINNVKNDANDEKKIELVSDNKEKDAIIINKEMPVEDRIGLYENPALMGASKENVIFNFEEFNPDVTEDFKVNPVKSIYDSNKAHD